MNNFTRNTGTLDINELVSQLKESANPVMYQYFKNLDEGNLLISGEIDDLTIEYFIMPLMQLDADPNVEEITIYLNSPGGSIFTGMTLCEAIERLKTPTKVVLLSYAYSMGGYILMSGFSNPNVKRVCYPFSTGLIHQGSTRLGGNSNDVEDTYEFYKKYNEKMNQYILDHSNIPSDVLDKHKRFEWYLTADEMLEYGLVDEII